MLQLTRLGGPLFALNPDLIERIDATPDTVVTLVGGTKYVVVETVEEIVTLIRHYRAEVIAEAQHLTGSRPSASVAPLRAHGGGSVVPLHPREV